MSGAAVNHVNDVNPGSRPRRAPTRGALGRLARLTGAAALMAAAPSPARSDDALPPPLPATRPAAAVLGPPAPVPAVPPTAARRAAIAKRWADLAAADPAARDAARVSLGSLGRGELPVLRDLVASQRPLLPAQAAVLRDVVTQAVLTGEDYPTDGRGGGFLGIRHSVVNLTLLNAPPPQFPAEFAPAPAAPADPDSVVAIAVLQRMPGFSGARAFQDGDLILGIVERPGLTFHSTDEFSTAVRLVGAGQTLHFQVLRQGRVIRVPATLDPRPDIPNVGWAGIEEMERFLEARQKRADEYWAAEFAPLLAGGVG